MKKKSLAKSFSGVNFFLVAILPSGLLFGQLFSGSDPLTAALFSGCAAVCFATFALAGGWNSFLAIIVLVWEGKLLVLALIVKVLIGESSTITLDAPRQTALVYFIGFVVILGGVLVQRILPIRKSEGLMPRLTPQLFLTMALVFFASSILAPVLAGDRDTYVMVIKAVGGFRDFSIYCAMHWAASRGAKRPFLHPLVLAFLGVCLLLSLISTSKQALLTPIFIYYLGVIALTRFRYPLAFLPIVPGIILFQFVLGPVADSMKSQTAGLNPLEAVSLVWKANFAAIANPEVSREIASGARIETEKRDDYYFRANVGYLERFSLVKVGDKLIYATTLQGHIGWGVIIWDLSCLPPRFILPSKPTQSSFNELARFSGMVGEDDYSTAVSFGLFPQLYSAVGYFGVVFLGFASVTVIFWWFRLFIGDHPQLTFYGLMLVGAVQHTIAEGILASFLSMFTMPIFIILAMAPAMVLVRLMGRDSSR